MYAAYDALSDGLKEFLRGLRAVNSSAMADVSKTREDRIADANEAGHTSAESYEAVHPVVRTHPETGRQALYVNVAHTARFEGMTEEESQPLLRFLFAHQSKAEFTCRFRWEAGSLALWDNRCAMHNPSTTTTASSESCTASPSRGTSPARSAQTIRESVSVGQ